MRQSAQTAHLTAFCNHAKVFAVCGIFRCLKSVRKLSRTADKDGSLQSRQLSRESPKNQENAAERES